jgi:hypothetical protein
MIPNVKLSWSGLMETLGDDLFFSSNTFLGVAKLHVFGRKK